MSNFERFPIVVVAAAFFFNAIAVSHGTSAEECQSPILSTLVGTQTVGPIGGGGGGSFFLACGHDEAVVGLSTSAGAQVDRVDAITCENVTTGIRHNYSLTKWGDNPAWDNTLTKEWGNTPTIASSGAFLTGFTALVGDYMENNEHAVICHLKPWFRTRVETLHPSIPTGKDKTEFMSEGAQIGVGVCYPYGDHLSVKNKLVVLWPPQHREVACKPGYVITKIWGKEGDRLDNIGITCSRLLELPNTSHWTCLPVVDDCRLHFIEKPVPQEGSEVVRLADIAGTESGRSLVESDPDNALVRCGGKFTFDKSATVVLPRPLELKGAGEIPIELQPAESANDAVVHFVISETSQNECPGGKKKSDDCFANRCAVTVASAHSLLRSVSVVGGGNVHRSIPEMGLCLSGDYSTIIGATIRGATTGLSVFGKSAVIKNVTTTEHDDAGVEIFGSGATLADIVASQNSVGVFVGNEVETLTIESFRSPLWPNKTSANTESDIYFVEKVSSVSLDLQSLFSFSATVIAAKDPAWLSAPPTDIRAYRKNDAEYLVIAQFSTDMPREVLITSLYSSEERRNRSCGSQGTRVLCVVPRELPEEATGDTIATLLPAGHKLGIREEGQLPYFTELFAIADDVPDCDPSDPAYTINAWAQCMKKEEATTPRAPQPDTPQGSDEGAGWGRGSDATAAIGAIVSGAVAVDSAGGVKVPEEVDGPSVWNSLPIMWDNGIPGVLSQPDGGTKPPAVSIEPVGTAGATGGGCTLLPDPQLRLQP